MVNLCDMYHSKYPSNGTMHGDMFVRPTYGRWQPERSASTSIARPVAIPPLTSRGSFSFASP